MSCLGPVVRCNRQRFLVVAAAGGYLSNLTGVSVYPLDRRCDT
jgi:hypothetical protein